MIKRLISVITCMTSSLSKIQKYWILFYLRMNELRKGKTIHTSSNLRENLTKLKASLKLISACLKRHFHLSDSNK